MSDWLAALAERRARGEPCVLVTVAAVEGSAPREPGTKMLVGPDDLHGTIGGGNLEHQATRLARELLADGSGGPVLRTYALGPELGQCCGGTATLLFEPMGADATALYLFGAGHVGREVVSVLAGLPFRIAWVDPRAGQFPRELPANARAVLAPAPETEVAAAPPGALFLVMTHEHDLDERIVEAVLRREDFAWIGLIGSATKLARFRKRLAARGVPGDRIDRIVCPIGIAGIGDKHPRAIAVAVAAQLLALRGGGA